MGKRRSKKARKKLWIEIDFDLCIGCGSRLEIMTNSKHADAFFNGDIIRCSEKCGVSGYFSIPENSHTGFISWDKMDQLLLKKNTNAIKINDTSRV